jgi:hypothetical protein
MKISVPVNHSVHCRRFFRLPFPRVPRVSLSFFSFLPSSSSLSPGTCGTVGSPRLTCQPRAQAGRDGRRQLQLVRVGGPGRRPLTPARGWPPSLPWTELQLVRMGFRASVIEYSVPCPSGLIASPVVLHRRPLGFTAQSFDKSNTNCSLNNPNP